MMCLQFAGARRRGECQYIHSASLGSSSWSGASLVEPNRADFAPTLHLLGMSGRILRCRFKADSYVHADRFHGRKSLRESSLGSSEP